MSVSGRNTNMSINHTSANFNRPGSLDRSFEITHVGHSFSNGFISSKRIAGSFVVSQELHIIVLHQFLHKELTYAMLAQPQHVLRCLLLVILLLMSQALALIINGEYNMATQRAYVVYM